MHSLDHFPRSPLDVFFSLQSLQKVLRRAKKIFLIHYGYKKTHNFTLISNLLKKFEKMHLKESYWQNRDGNMHFFIFTQNLFCLYLYFGAFFTTFSTDS
jgi:hypothetical protein